MRPLELDLRVVFRVGTGLWAVALVVVGVLAARGTADARAVAICATGFALGFVGQAWEVRHRRAARRASGPDAG
ncbi:MAG: DUF2530 domain-containing protein [Actinomycetales bacterium]|nr:DUF2530 domain-containing protein [Actinomycetales bacterium]